MSLFFSLTGESDDNASTIWALIGTIHAVIIGFRRGHAERRREPIGDGTRLLSQPSPGRRADRVCGNGVDWVTEKRRKVDCSRLASDAPPRNGPQIGLNFASILGQS